MRSFSISSVDPSLVDTALWPQVDEYSIADPRSVDLFLRRRKAVQDLLTGAQTRSILAETRLARPEIVRLIKRCLRVHPDGRIYGFRALIPQTRLVRYQRRTTAKLQPDCPTGAAGVFMQLITNYPVLASLVELHVFKLAKRQHIHESRIPIKGLHKRFIDKCRELGLNQGCQYPFNTKTLGYVSLATHVRKLLRNPDRAAHGSLGDDIAKKLRSGDGTQRPVTKPVDANSEYRGPRSTCVRLHNATVSLKNGVLVRHFCLWQSGSLPAPP